MMLKPAGVTLVLGSSSGRPVVVREHFCVFPLLYLSPAITPSFSTLTFFRNLFLSLSFLFISRSYVIVLLHAPLSLRPFDQSYLPPPQRTLSPCRFLFPVRQLSYFLFLCYQNGRLPLLCVTWLSSRSSESLYS